MRLKKPKRPSRPAAPIKPTKQIVKRIDNSREFSGVSDFFEFLIARHGDVKLSDKKVIDDLEHYHLDYSLGYPGWGYDPTADVFIKFSDVRLESYENADFEKQNSQYLDKCIKYKSDYGIYKEKLADYNKKMEEYRDEVSRREIKKAEKIIKSNSKKYKTS